MNHVFIMQVHKDSALLKRILHHLSAPNHYFAINVDKKSVEKEDIISVINEIPNVISLTEMSIWHSGFSFSDCIIKQLQYCYEYETHFDFYHTCSGQDYPCVSNRVFDAFFDSTKSYTKMDTQEQIEKWRYTKYKFRLDRFNFCDQIHGKWVKKLHINGIIRRLPIRKPYPELEKIWGGWNWFSLSDNCVGYLFDYFNSNPHFLERFRYTTAADELVFSTVLYYQRESLNIETNNSLRYIEWYPRREHKSLPLVLDEREYEDIINSGAFFCRKVESSYSAKLLDMLDKRIEAQI